MYPDVRLVVLAPLYGVPAKMDKIAAICKNHGTLLIEDAAEGMGARYDGETVSGMCGSFGVYCAVSSNGNKIVAGCLSSIKKFYIGLSREGRRCRL